MSQNEASYQDAATRLFSTKDLRTLVRQGDAKIEINDETGTLFFVYASVGIAFNPKVGAWSAPLDFPQRLQSDWINSLGRAIERTEAQIAVAKVAGAEAIRVDVERAQRLVDEIKDLQDVLRQYNN